jgi:hypothetical protein
MKTKSEIQSLKKKWIDKSKEHDDKRDELIKLGEEKNGDADIEIEDSDKKFHRLADEVKQALKDYHDACYENYNERKSTLSDADKEKFENGIRETNDWDQLMDKYGLW